MPFYYDTQANNNMLDVQQEEVREADLPFFPDELIFELDEDGLPSVGIVVNGYVIKLATSGISVGSLGVKAGRNCTNDCPTNKCTITGVVKRG